MITTTKLNTHPSSPDSLECDRFINAVQNISTNIPSNKSWWISIKKIFFSLIDKIPILETNYLAQYEFKHSKDTQCLNQEIINITQLAEKIIASSPKFINKKFYGALYQLFSSILPKLDVSPFTKQNKMPLLFQNALSPELNLLRREKKDHPHLAFDPQHTLKRKIAKAKLALSLGHGREANKGGMGTIIILDINNKRIGVHKVSTQDIPYETQLKYFFQSFFGQLSFLSKHPMAQPQTEKMAYHLSRDLAFNMAPPSTDAVLKYKGVMQLFVSKIKKLPTTGVPHSQTLLYNEAAKFTKEFNRSHFSESEATVFQKFALFDFIIGNLDRHEENWFVIFADNPKGTKTLIDIKAIDNANAFPKNYPRPFMKKETNYVDNFLSPGRHQYKWKNLAIARVPFTKEIKNFVKTHLSPENIDRFLENQKREMPEFFDKNMLHLFFQRAAKVREMVLASSETPESLIKSTDRDFW